MADNVSGRDVYRGGAGVSGERRGGAETIDRAYPAEDLAGRERADTAQVGQGGAGVGDCGLYVCGGLSDAAVQLAYLSDQVGGKATQGSAGCIAGTDPRRSSAARSAVRSRFAPAGMRLVSTTWRRLTV